ncbi:MAG: NTP transferase domain-containing protein [Oscillospiraceae bacterium]|nr:NTP transferase domain-containing protein [Oscillospiraceae bacterium]
MNDTAKELESGMLACILAGGEGTRLRPLTAFTPKPMVELGERPVLGHILKRLKSFGVDRAAITLMYLPEVIRESIGDGEEYGIEISYRVETSPLGTAGAVRACADLIRGGEEVLVLSGDGITDIDFAQMLSFHREKGADVSIALTSVSEPTEYGIVKTDEEGRILCFAEKPEWNGVFTDTVNTGVYILSPSAVEQIPPGVKFDFSKDLFPKMLPEGKIFGFETKGYWCDIGDPKAYLKAHMDYLECRTGFFPETREVSDGLWISEKAEVSQKAKLCAPVLICDGARVEKGAVVGPVAVIGCGAAVGEGATVVGSAIYGELGANAEAEDAIVCRGGRVGACSVLRRNSIVGPRAFTGDNSFVVSGGVLAENEQLENGGVKKSCGVHGGKLNFENGEICADGELCFSLGEAVCADGKKRVLVGSDERGSVLSSALISGLLCGGAEVIGHDGGFAAAGAELGVMLKADVSIFVSGDKVRFFGESGLPLEEKALRKLSSAVLRGNGGTKQGSLKQVLGAGEVIASAHAEKKARKLRVCVASGSRAAETLEKALRLSGFEITTESDALLVGINSDGFGLRIWNKSEFSCEHSLGMALLALAEDSRQIAVPNDAPSAFALGINRKDASVLRVGRDKGAEALAARQRVGFFGIPTAITLLSYLDSSGKSPEILFSELPRYAVRSAEVACETPKAELMRKLVGSFSKEESDGVTVSTRQGNVRLTPSALRSSIRITAEAANAEIAQSIAQDLVRLAKKLDIKS